LMMYPSSEYLSSKTVVGTAFVKRISCGNSMIVAHVASCTVHSYWCTWQLD
jgi:hypothetical protein